MQSLVRILFCTLFLVGLAPAASSFAQVQQQTPQSVSPVAGGGPVASSTDSDTMDSYRLGIADKVRIIVFDEASLSGEFIVSDSGTLSLPLIGDVRASGRTPNQLIHDIQARLADGYLKSPRVSMDVLTYRPFYILGEVGKPGEYAYSAGLTVLNAVARAEGFTYRANKKKAFLKRAGAQAEEQVLLTPELRVGPGDTIRIGERYF